MDNVLDRQEIEIVRAKYIKEIAVTVDPNREIAFGNDKVTLRRVEEWLAKKGRINSCWTKVAGVAAIIAAIAAIAAVVITLIK